MCCVAPRIGGADTETLPKVDEPAWLLLLIQPIRFSRICAHLRVLCCLRGVLIGSLEVVSNGNCRALQDRNIAVLRERFSRLHYVVRVVLVAVPLFVFLNALCTQRGQGRNAADLVAEGGVHLKHSDLDSAIACFNDAIQLNPHDPIAYIPRGLAYDMKGMPDRALADCTTAIRLGPGLREAYLARASVHERHGNAHAAQADYARAGTLERSGG